MAKGIISPEMVANKLAEEIQFLSMGIEKLMEDSQLNKEAILLLIHHACLPKTKRPSLRTIRQVLDGIGNLHEYYIKKEEEG